ncbi:hypothetical protein DSCA_09640 [Desulfosarcina alkanivorans]|uniref:Uncharacterized protein n=1 Tax=Desulfosarcina alkanivorans TaxID=571177 RepID=A0A5K7YL61_9BACT|nr:hypothetical protein DSCA_09640 [Desulfosarcina alkanivorans]
MSHKKSPKIPSPKLDFSGRKLKKEIGILGKKSIIIKKTTKPIWYNFIIDGPVKMWSDL